MRGWLVVALIVSVPRTVSGQAVSEGREDSLRTRADSLARLEPANELRVALERGDRRCIAVQGYLALPALMPVDSLKAAWPILCAYGMNVIPGTSDFVTPGVKRLNDVAFDYGLRYNRLLLQWLRQSGASQEAPPPAPPRAPEGRPRPAT